MASAQRVELADAVARRRIAEDLGATLFVEAAAGTGKTTALVARVVALLRTGVATLEQIAAVTFTEKAAGEMKLRLRAEIERARISSQTTEDERRRFEAALGQLELARIGTIHGFCSDLLHERPVEAGVDPLFAVAAAEESERLLSAAFDGWLEETLSDPPEGVRRVLRRRPRGFGASSPREQLQTAVRNLVEHRDFPAPFRREPFDRDRAIDDVMRELEGVSALARLAQSSEDWLAKNLEELAHFALENRLREEIRGREYDGLEADLRDLVRSTRIHWNWRGARNRRFADGVPREEVIARRDALKEQLEALADSADAELAALLREELRPVVARYEARKEASGRLDFLDLLLRARNLIRDDDSVREELQRRFTHLFVDEFQDTDPLQAEILILLAANDPAVSDFASVVPVPGKLFVVGDPKQSIYRFRRADVSIYERAKEQLVRSGAEVLHLTTSFRSVPSLQHLVNAAFEPRMPGGDGGADGQARYVALEPYRAEVEGRPGIVALPVPRPYGDYGKVANWKIEESLPDAVGAWVDWLVNESGYVIDPPDGEGPPVRIEARHVCLLFRRFKSFGDDVTRPYVRALEARRIPHVLVGGRSFHEREEVQAIRNALAAIEWPDDELSVFATLRGPFVALGDDALLAYRYRSGESGLGRRLHTLRRPDAQMLVGWDAPEREVAEALAILGELHVRRNRRPIAETLSRLFEALRVHAGVAIWPTGEQALANCLRVLDLARRFEARGATSFRAFVTHLQEEAESGEAQDAPVVEEGTEGVRIMTVHRAKGLEFPVVILADPTAAQVPRNPSRHIDGARGLWAEALCGCTPHDLLDAADLERARDAAEAVRVAYVAATRAREMLVVPVVGDEPRAGWLDMLNPALYPLPANRRAAAPAPGCPAFGEESVVDRGAGYRGGSHDSVRPGRHVPALGSHEVVWWDPHVLDLDRREEVGLRQERILVADEEGTVAEEGVRAHARWQAEREATLVRGAVPTLDVRPVTALALEPAPPGVAPDAPVVTHEVAARKARPGGRRFGSLVHAILAVVDLDADASGVVTTTRAQQRLLGASDEEASAATEVVTAALDHPVLRRAAAAGKSGALRRETPVLLVARDGPLAEGVVDLAFREGEGASARWTVVDFKTDREIGEQRQRYERQVTLYVQAIAKATQQPADGVLLVV